MYNNTNYHQIKGEGFNFNKVELYTVKIITFTMSTPYVFDKFGQSTVLFILS